MKKNININLFGTIYAIDEDAYELMESYLQNIKDYFSKIEGGEEVADDIEHRFAELLWEKKQQGVDAIDIMTVKEIIKKIGNPEDLDESAADGQTATEGNQSAADEEPKTTAEKQESAGESAGPRKFYRDGKDKLVGGVMSGLAHYTGGSDPFPWRIALVILFIVIPKSGWIAVLYLIAWMLFPEAKTAEERLRMMGKPVTTDNIGAEVMNEAKPKPQQQSGARGCLGSMLNVVAVLFKAMLYVTIAFFGFITLIVLFSVCAGLFALPFGLMGSIFDGVSSPDNALQTVQLMAYLQDSKGLIVFLGCCLLVVVVLPIYALIHMLTNSNNRFSMTTKLSLLLLWFVALCGSAFCSFKVITQMDEKNIHFDVSNVFDDSDSQSDRTSKEFNDLESFRELDLNCVACVEYFQGDTCKVVVKGKPGTVDKIGVVSQNGVLQIWNQEEIKGNNNLKIRITSPDLTRVSMDGVGAFEAEDGIITPGVLTLTQKGVGAMEVKAKCRTLIYNGKGVGAAELKVDTDSLIVNAEGIGAVSLSGKTGYFKNNRNGIGGIDTEELTVTN